MHGREGVDGDGGDGVAVRHHAVDAAAGVEVKVLDELVLVRRQDQRLVIRVRQDLGRKTD